MLGEVDVLFIALHNPFDRTQGRVGGGKASRLTDLKYHLDSAV